MALKLANNATSTLSAAIISTDLVVSIASVDGSKFPTLDTGDWFPITIVDPAGNMEVMRVTGRIGDSVFNVVRAQEGTTAKDFEAGSRVDLRLTSGAVQDASILKTGTLLDSLLSFTVSAFSKTLLDDTTQSAWRTTLGLGSVALFSVVPVANGGTGATTASNARANLGANDAANLNTGVLHPDRLVGTYSGLILTGSGFTFATSGASGIAATPSGTFNNGRALAIGDSNSGIRQLSEDIIEIWTGDTRRVRVSDTVFTYNDSPISVVYTGSSASETNFPLGHTVNVIGTPPARNGLANIRLSTASSDRYVDSGGGPIPAGVYRSRGAISDTSYSAARTV